MLKSIKSFNLQDKRFLTVLSIIVGLVAGYCVINPTRLTVGIPATMFFFLLTMLVVPLFSKDPKEKKVILYLALTAFLLRAVVAFVLVSISLYVIKDQYGGYSFANDAYRYLNSALRLIEHFEQGGNVGYLFVDRHNWMNVTLISNTFPWVAFLITLLFGSYQSLLVGGIYSAFVTGLTIVLIFKIAKELLPEVRKANAIDAALIAICYPSFIMFTCVMLKEATVIFISYLLLYIFYKYNQDKKPYYLLVFFVGLVLLAGLRFYGAAIVLVSISLGYVASIFKMDKSSHKIKALIAIVLFFIFALTIGKSIFRVDYLISILDLETLQSTRETHYGDASTYFELGDLSSPMGLLKALPLGLSYMMLAPFPWQWFGGGTDIVEKALAPDMIIYYILLPSAFIGVYRILKQRPLLGLLLIFYYLALALPYSIMIGNFGTIYRLRTQLLPALVVFAVLGGTPLVKWCYAMIKAVYTNVTKMPVKPTSLDM